tara:strand:+ start:144 stop:860 length:717 start_codon:yes stop_codon:yes gene_type:complete
MGYKRTVHCSYCGESGHNKSGCPAWKERIETYRAEYGSDYYAVRAYDDKKARKANSAKNRKCSYCGDGGHNKAGCPKQKVAMEAFRTKNIEYRKNFLAALIESGLGPGAMIKTTQSWNDRTFLSMVMSIDWANAHMADRSADIIITRPVNRINNTSWNAETRLPKNVTGQNWGPDYEVVVPTSEIRIREGMPATFLAGTLGLKQTFRDKEYGLHTMKDHWGDFDDEFDPDKYSTTIGD